MASWVYAIPLAALLFAANAAVYKYLAANVALFLVSVTLVTFVATPALREFAETLAAERERKSRMAFLGRISAQLAHDLRNPLAALKGAMDSLREDEHDASKVNYLELMSEQVERIRDVIDRYLRIGSLDPEFDVVSLNAIVSRCIEAQALAFSDVSFECHLADDLPECSADPYLLSVALENLLKNACEATDGRGAVSVTTEFGATPSTVLIQVQDDGRGIEPKDRERVFDDFFTTRETGSGLGLSFVRQVARAHGGDVNLESRPGVRSSAWCSPSRPGQRARRCSKGTSVGTGIALHVTKRNRGGAPPALDP